MQRAWVQFLVRELSHRLFSVAKKIFFFFKFKKEKKNPYHPLILSHCGWGPALGNTWWIFSLTFCYKYFLHTFIFFKTGTPPKAWYWGNHDGSSFRRNADLLSHWGPQALWPELWECYRKMQPSAYFIHAILLSILIFPSRNHFASVRFCLSS